MASWVQAGLSYFRQRDRAWLLSLLAAVCLVYLPFLGNPFFFADVPFFTTDVARQYAHSLFQFDLRWLPYASLGWTAAIFGDAVALLFHLGNTLLHAANVILIFFLLRRLVGAVITGPEKSSAIIWGAWLGALVFACHPLAVYAVGYVVQRSILMATLFALVMQLAYLHALLSGRKRWLWLSVAAYFLAVFADEHSVLLPAVLGTMTILLRAENKLALKKLDSRALWLGWGAFFAIGLLLILRVQGVFGTPYQPLAAFMFGQPGVAELSAMQHLLHVLTQMGLFFKYLLLWLLPNPAWMAVDMRVQAVTSWTAWQGWAGALGFIAYGTLAFRLLLRGGGQGLAGWALLYPWLLFGVEFFSARAQEPFVLARSYLWLPGMMLFLPLLLLKLPGRRTLLVLGLAVLLLAPLAWNRLWVFGDNYRLWNDAALLLPSEQTKGEQAMGEQVAGADRILFNRGLALVAVEKWDEAAADFQRVVALNPQLPPARHALGMAYVNLERFPEAVVQFDAGIALDPGDARLYFGKGLALMRLRQGAQAAQLMKKACEMGNEMTACMMSGLMNGKK